LAGPQVDDPGTFLGGLATRVSQHVARIASVNRRRVLHYDAAVDSAFAATAGSEKPEKGA
jgi:hypothetical protein